MMRGLCSISEHIYIIHQTFFQSAVSFHRSTQSSLTNDANVRQDKPELSNGFISERGGELRRKRAGSRGEGGRRGGGGERTVEWRKR